jgi:hypothetical protein
MSAKVLQFVRTQIPGRSPGEFTRELDTAYGRLSIPIAEVLLEFGEAGVLALVRLTGDVLAEIRAHKGAHGAAHTEELLAALSQQARKP